MVDATRTWSETWRAAIFQGASAAIVAVFCYSTNASRLCAVAVTVITIIPRPGPAYQVAFHRFMEVSYGVVCALAYTVVVERVRRRRRQSGSSG